eukprot:Pgem_evm1s14281
MFFIIKFLLVVVCLIFERIKVSADSVCHCGDYFTTSIENFSTNELQVPNDFLSSCIHYADIITDSDPGYLLNNADLPKYIELNVLKRKNNIDACINGICPSNCTHLNCQSRSKVIFDAIQPNCFNDFKKLTTLDMKFNQVLVLFSGSFNGLESLTALDLSSNQLCNLNTIRYNPIHNNTLDINNNNNNNNNNNDNNKDTSIVNVFKQLKNLELLDLGSNSIFFIGPGKLDDLTKLQSLQFPSNMLSELDVSIFHQLSAVEELSFQYNRLSTFGNSIFPFLPKLTDIDFSSNLLSSLPFDFFAQTSNLNTLQLQNNFFPDFPPALGVFFDNNNTTQGDLSPILFDFSKNPIVTKTTIPNSLKEFSMDSNNIVSLPILPRCCAEANQNFLKIIKNANITLYSGGCATGNSSKVRNINFLDFDLNSCKYLESDCKGHSVLSPFRYFDYVNYVCVDNSTLYISIIAGSIGFVLVCLITVLGVWYYRKRMKQKDLLDGLTPEEVMYNQI